MRARGQTSTFHISVRVDNAGLKGKGLFAKAPILSQARIASFAGTPMWVWDIPERYWPYTYQVDYDQYVLPRSSSRARYINHSCEPNCVVSGRTIVAVRRIGTGEELTIDYSTDIDWPGFRMACKCGSPRCRKVIRAYRYLPKKLKLGYGRRVADFILREYGPVPTSPKHQRVV